MKNQTEPGFEPSLVSDSITSSIFHLIVMRDDSDEGNLLLHHVIRLAPETMVSFRKRHDWISFLSLTSVKLFVPMMISSRVSCQLVVTLDGTPYVVCPPPPEVQPG